MKTADVTNDDATRKRMMTFLLTEERKALLCAFLERNGLENTSLELLEEATTHRSYANEHQTAFHNERLEYLGDSVISLVVSTALYKDFQTMDEGEMSRHRSSIVSRSSLGRRAHEIGLQDIMLLGVSEEANGGRERPTLIGSALEAVVGAVYLSRGMAVVKKFITRYIYQPGLPEVDMREFIDYKSRLQEFVQKVYHTTPEYSVVREIGPDHDKQFEIEATVLNERVGRGLGSRKRLAENAAAQSAYEQFRKIFADEMQMKENK
ncbi:MAG: ribonuclease III [Candidatus Sumerlaeales bacterium]|nr:ribonuclease III [Candidatus Sumerlaeales bacterium]